MVRVDRRNHATLRRPPAGGDGPCVVAIHRVNNGFGMTAILVAVDADEVFELVINTVSFQTPQLLWLRGTQMS